MGLPGFVTRDKAARENRLNELLMLKEEARRRADEAQRELDRHRLAHAAALITELMHGATHAKVYVTEPSANWDASAEVHVIYNGNEMAWNMHEDDGLVDDLAPAGDLLAGAYRLIAGGYTLDLRAGTYV